MRTVEYRPINLMGKKRKKPWACQSWLVSLSGVKTPYGSEWYRTKREAEARKQYLIDHLPRPKKDAGAV